MRVYAKNALSSARLSGIGGISVGCTWDTTILCCSSKINALTQIYARKRIRRLEEDITYCQTTLWIDT